ncbi:MFS general substrate transporter [Cucurbitaria berberidis CBS 394.84]|uniref:MFS general substrate transporter n=1 Tax=Cucurbitaria berberidis CBS 394.84 TaxID=1168544 RepID=A0A9P4LCY3_9PLEO|nr:MFS general substrate transporter [Cucurbitaria berberidis CBS 394.84]KAF1850163.1 MFS general substrate transporter [Cucurbitaria berberidis CBS 394.84]
MQAAPRRSEVDAKATASLFTQDKSDEKAPPGNDELYSIFPASTRTHLTYSLGIILILSTLTATIYFPLIPTLSTHFSVSIQAINLTVTVYAICQAISPGIFASLADSYGRRPVLLALVLIYALGSLGLVLNKNSYAALMALRAVQSIGGSSIPSIAYGIVADVAVVSERGKMLGPMLATCNGISAVGPVIGGALALKTGGHKWVFVALLIIAVACFLAVGFTLPETSRVVAGNGSRAVHGIWKTWMDVLRGKKKQKEDRKQRITHEINVPVVKASQSLRRVVDSLRIILHPDAAAILRMIASSYGVYYTFQVAISVIFADVYAYNELQIGLAFLPGLSGMTIGGIIAGRLIDANYAKAAQKHNIDISQTEKLDLTDFPIEYARYRMIVPFIVAQTALVTSYGWAVQQHVHPAVPIILQFFICALSTLLSHTASALLVDVFPDVPSTAYASSQLARCGFSAASAAIIEPLVNAVGRGWFFTIFSLFTGLSCLFCVVVSRWKGIEWRRKRLDAKSRASASHP